jgi:hypothetical protein
MRKVRQPRNRNEEHHIGVDMAARRVVEGVRQRAGDRKAHALPQLDGAAVGADHEIELHGAEAELLGLLDRVDAHRPRDAFLCLLVGDDIAAIGDMGAAAALVGAQKIGADHAAHVFGDEHMMAARVPVGERLGAGDVAGDWIGLAGAKHRLKQAPDRVVVLGRGRSDVHCGPASSLSQSC